MLVEITRAKFEDTATVIETLKEFQELRGIQEISRPDYGNRSVSFDLEVTDMYRVVAYIHPEKVMLEKSNDKSFLINVDGKVIKTFDKTPDHMVKAWAEQNDCDIIVSKKTSVVRLCGTEPNIKVLQSETVLKEFTKYIDTLQWCAKKGYLINVGDIIC